jgi:hypothetical protein
MQEQELKPGYYFGTFEFPAMDIEKDPLSQQHLRIANITAFAGKLINFGTAGTPVYPFYKVTATFA